MNPGHPDHKIVDRTKIGDVENARFRFRQKVRARMRRGQLTLPPGMRAQPRHKARTRRR